MEFRTAIPDEAGACVAMGEYKGHIILACQYCVYQLNSTNNTFEKIKFVNKEGVESDTPN